MVPCELVEKLYQVKNKKGLIIKKDSCSECQVYENDKLIFKTKFSSVYRARRFLDLIFCSSYDVI